LSLTCVGAQSLFAFNSQPVAWQSQLGFTTGFAQSPSFGASFGTQFSSPASQSAGLPTCTAEQCGRAISWNDNVVGTPVCLCNPMCQTMAGTSGVLPCCPGLQQVCLDPWRSSSPGPTPSSSTAFAQPTFSQALSNAIWPSQPVQPQSAVQLQSAPVHQQSSPIRWRPSGYLRIG